MKNRMTKFLLPMTVFLLAVFTLISVSATEADSLLSGSVTDSSLATPRIYHWDYNPDTFEIHYYAENYGWGEKFGKFLSGDATYQAFANAYGSEVKTMIFTGFRKLETDINVLGCPNVERIWMNGVTNVPRSVTENKGIFRSLTALKYFGTGENGGSYDHIHLGGFSSMDGVTYNLYGMFEGCTSIEKVTFGDTPFTVSSADYTAVAPSMFSGCTSLSDVTLPEWLTAINASAFKNCTNLKSITIPASVTTISSTAFTGAGLETLIYEGEDANVIINGGIGKSVAITVKSYAVKSALEEAGYESVTLDTGDADPLWQGYAFQDLSNGGAEKWKKFHWSYEPASAALTFTMEASYSGYGGEQFLLQLSADETYQEFAAAYGECVEIMIFNTFCKFEIKSSQTIKDNLGCPNVKTIVLNGDPEDCILQATDGSYAGFSGLTSLKNFNYKGSVDAEGIDLSNIVTFSNETTGTALFKNCSAIEKVRFDEDTPFMLGSTSYTKLFPNMFDGCTSLKDIVLPSWLTVIGKNAFKNCTSLETLTIPASVTTIDTTAFTGCTALNEIVMEGTNTDAIINSGLSKLISIVTPDEEVRQTLFDAGFTNVGIYVDPLCIGSVTDPDNAAKVYHWRYDPETFTVTYTVVGASWGENLPKVLSEDATYQQFAATYGKDVKTMIIKDFDKLATNVTLLGCPNTERIVLINGNRVNSAGVFRNLTNLKYFAIGNGNVADYVNLTGFTGQFDNLDKMNGFFSGCTAVEKVVFDPKNPLNLYGVGDYFEVPAYMFDGCTSLTEVVFPEWLKTINAYSFRNCTSLTSVTIPASVETIKATAFSGSGLSSITYLGYDGNVLINAGFDKDIEIKVIRKAVRDTLEAAGYTNVILLADYDFYIYADETRYGSISGIGAHHEDENVTLTAIPLNENYAFSHWNVISGALVLSEEQKTSSSISFVMTSDDMKIEAIFKDTVTGDLDLTGYVNTMIGVSGATTTGSMGNCTIGPQNPHASISPGPQTYPASLKTGYMENGEMRGFTQLHFGTGGATKYGQFLVSPQVGLVTGFEGHDSPKSNEYYSSSEYRVTLDRYGIDTALTPSDHSAIYRFTYPESDESAIMIDVEHYFLDKIESKDAKNLCVDISTDAEKTMISGSGYYTQGWAKYSVYFYAEVNVAATETGTYSSATMYPGVNSIENGTMSKNGTGAYLKFNTTEGQDVYLKIAVSFKSVEQAKTWLDAEIPEWDYDGIKMASVKEWNAVLNNILIDGDTSFIEKQKFYTSLFHAYLNPNYRTGDLPNEAYGDSVMTDNHIAGWDTWRTLFSLYSIIDRDVYADNVNSFITRYENERALYEAGGTYEFRDIIIGDRHFTNQGGDDLDNIIAEAYLKGIEGLDYDKIYELLKFNSEVLRVDFPGGISSSANGYKTQGWIPADNDGSGRRIMCASYQLEYAYNDYVAAQVAKAEGDMETYKTLIERSNSWLNIWNENASYTRDDGNGTYTGFVWPKKSDGTWIEPDADFPSVVYYCKSWVPYFYEGSSYDYSFFVPQDVYALIEKMGGEEAFLDRLSYGVEKGFVNFDLSYVNIGNEPAFLSAFLPNYTSKPWITSENVAKMKEQFDGLKLPGDDDAGTMSAWYMFASMGIFPHAGQDFYYLTSPYYETSTLDVGDGKTFTIRALNLSEENKYIQSVTLNGEPYYSTMLKHADIICGGELVFTMGSEPVNYAKSPNAEISSLTVAGVEAVKLGNGVYEVTVPEGTFLTADDFVIALAGEGATLTDAERTDYGWSFTVGAEDGVNIKVYDVFVEGEVLPEDMPESGMSNNGIAVRVNSYNGFRTHYSFNTSVNEDNGFRLVEFGTIYATVKNYNQYKETFGRDDSLLRGTEGSFTTPKNSIIKTPIYMNEEYVGTYQSVGSDTVKFTVTLINFSGKEQMTTPITSCGYEIWEKDGSFYVIYTKHEYPHVRESSLLDATLNILSSGKITIDGTNNPIWKTIDICKEADITSPADGVLGVIAKKNEEYFAVFTTDSTGSISFTSYTVPDGYNIDKVILGKNLTYTPE